MFSIKCDRCENQQNVGWNDVKDFGKTGQIGKIAGKVWCLVLENLLCPACVKSFQIVFIGEQKELLKKYRDEFSAVGWKKCPVKKKTGGRKKKNATNT